MSPGGLRGALQKKAAPAEGAREGVPPRWAAAPNEIRAAPPRLERSDRLLLQLPQVEGLKMRGSVQAVGQTEVGLGCWEGSA